MCGNQKEVLDVTFHLVPHLREGLFVARYCEPQDS